MIGIWPYLVNTLFIRIVWQLVFILHKEKILYGYHSCGFTIMTIKLNLLLVRPLLFPYDINGDEIEIFLFITKKVVANTFLMIMKHDWSTIIDQASENNKQTSKGCDMLSVMVMQYPPPLQPICSTSYPPTLMPYLLSPNPHALPLTPPTLMPYLLSPNPHALSLTPNPYALPRISQPSCPISYP